MRRSVKSGVKSKKKQIYETIKSMQVMEKTLVLPSAVRIRTMMREYRRDLFPISLHKTWKASMIWFLTDESGHMLYRLTEKVVLT